MRSSPGRIGRSEGVTSYFLPLGVGPGQEPGHARVGIAGVVHAQGRHLDAVERCDLRAEDLDLRGAVADLHVDDDADASDHGQRERLRLRHRGLVALDEDAEAALPGRGIRGHRDLEAIADGAAAGQCTSGRSMATHGRQLPGVSSSWKTTL